MTGEPKKRSEHEREPDEHESGSVNMQFIEIRHLKNVRTLGLTVSSQMQLLDRRGH